MPDKKEKPKTEPKQPNLLLQEFLEKEGLIIVPTPRFVNTNHGTFEIEVSVGVRRKQ